MIIRKLIVQVSLFWLACFNGITTIAQNGSLNDKFPEFANYRTWGYTVNPVINRAPTFERTSGNVEVRGLPVPGFNFGFDKVFRAEREFSYRYGIYLNLLPITSYEFSLPDGDIPNRDLFNFSERRTGQLVISIPLEIELKKQMGSKLYFSGKIGVNLSILRQGSVLNTVTTTLPEINEVRQIFGVRSLTREFPLYPNLKISPGFYYMTKRVLYQVSIIYQKAIPNYFRGEFLFDNLDISERTEGNYTLSGDQIGLGITLFLRKSKKRLKKLKSKAIKNVYL